MKTLFKRKLRRNLQRRLIGGVCAGIADFLGVDVVWVRLVALVSIFISFSLTFWIYLALWFFIPARTQIAIPNVSPRLKRHLRQLDKLVRKMHHRLEASVADQAQDAFDAIKILSARFDSNFSRMNAANRSSSDQARLMWEEGIQRFSQIAEQLVNTPNDFAYQNSSAGSPHQKLVEELDRLHDDLIQTAAAVLTEESTPSTESREDSTSRLRAWKKHYSPLKQRLSARADPDTLTILNGIEEKLELLLGQESVNELFDLKPFEVQKIAFDYLPDAIREYLRLPSAMAKTQHLNNGKTAEQSLKEQLTLLDGALQKLAQSLFNKDAQGLLVHGRFLKEKFTDHPFRVS